MTRSLYNKLPEGKIQEADLCTRIIPRYVKVLFKS